MAISDVAARIADRRTNKGPSCTVCQELQKLPDDEAKALTQLLSDSSLTYTDISDGLRDEGVDLPAYNLSRHSRGNCQARTKLR